MTILTLDALEAAHKVAMKQATPHREPDFAFIRSQAINGGDSIVTGGMVFLEEHNTGYDGVLYRYILGVNSKDGKRISFQIDLMPGQITIERRKPDENTYHDVTL